MLTQVPMMAVCEEPPVKGWVAQFTLAICAEPSRGKIIAAVDDDGQTSGGAANLPFAVEVQVRLVGELLRVDAAVVDLVGDQSRCR